jgi:ApaG protein
MLFRPLAGNTPVQLCPGCQMQSAAKIRAAGRKAQSPGPFAAAFARYFTTIAYNYAPRCNICGGSAINFVANVLSSMYSQITQGVQITVETFYQPEYSQPLHQEFMFAYRITLENHNPFTVQLISRQWFIADSNGDHREVEGEGVVGQQPVLSSGENFQYVSGCNLKSELGKMWGHYQMLNLDSRELFAVDIPVFQMEAPMKMN